jgi:hypothetical protein
MPLPLMPEVSRTEVGWLGGPPPSNAVDEFRRFYLNVRRCDVVRIRDAAYLGTLAAIVVVLDVNSKLGRTADILKENVHNALDNGCDIFVLANNQGEAFLRKIVLELLLPINGLAPKKDFTWQDPAETQIAPSVSFYGLGTPFTELARLVLERRVPDRPNLALDFKGESVNANDELLMRRAFKDYTQVYVTKLSDGYSGAVTYKVQAERYGGKPIPYFVKIGTRRDTLQEYSGYLVGVEPYIPFYLAPPLIKENCCLAATRGILVEHFVSESESLLRCAEGGRAVSAIACLFSRTLNAWHRPSCDKTLGEFLEAKFPTKVNSEVWSAIQRLGKPRDIAELRSIFDRYGGSLRVPYGWIHGDLHADNVMVRGTDAVIIDMEKYTAGPMLWDPACLEASLLIEGFRNDRRDSEAWFASIRSCYRGELFNFWSHDHLTDPSSWFHVAINQTRLYVCSMQQRYEEYFTTLSTALLWKACKGAAAVTPSFTSAQRDAELARRAAAYLIAQDLLERLDQGNVGNLA